MSKPLDRLDFPTIHGIVRSMMSANFEDAMDAKRCQETGEEWDADYTRAKELERALCTLSQCISVAMTKGELTPFNGDYRTWLVNIGLVSEGKFKVENEKR